jgi:hypothetical protein
MRKWIFILFLATFFLLLMVAPFSAVAVIPSVLLSYWVWRDGEAIEDLYEEIELLRKRIKS